MKISIEQKEDIITLSFTKHKSTQFIELTRDQTRVLKELLEKEDLE